MSKIADLIKDFLLIEDTLDFKNLGTFKIEQTSASIHPIIHTFEPPKTIIKLYIDFNKDFSNNFLSFAYKHNITLNELNEFAQNIIQQLNKKDNTIINNLGEIKKIDEKTFYIELDQLSILQGDNFALPSFTAKVVPKKLQQQEQKTENKKGRSKNIVIVVSIIILLILLIPAIYFFSQNYINQNTVKNSRKEQIKPAPVVDNKISAETKKVEVKDSIVNAQTEINNLPSTSSSVKNFFIVDNIFSVEEFAKNRIEFLKNNGFPEALQIDRTSKGHYIVGYGGYSTKEEATEELKKIKQNFNPNAWIYEKK